jgi:hypothetical protein
MEGDEEGEDRRGKLKKKREEKSRNKLHMLHSFGSTRCFSPLLHKFQQGSSSSSLKLHYDGSGEREKGA